MSIRIEDESTHLENRYQLYIDNGPRALLTEKNGLVQLVWQVQGPQYWPEARMLLQGLLELSIIADSISGAKSVH